MGNTGHPLHDGTFYKVSLIGIAYNPARKTSLKVLLQCTRLEVLYDSDQISWNLLERRAQINESRVTKN